MTLTPFILAVIALVIFAALEVQQESRAKEQKIREVFAGRESLTPEAFYERHFLALGVAPEVVIGIRKILEEQLGADMSRLRAEDDFSQNLSFFWDFDSMANVEIVVALEKLFQIRISDLEAEKTYTVSDLVQLVSRKTGRPTAL